MDQIKLNILGLSPCNSESTSCVLILDEENGTRKLPIVIGLFEAQSIAMAMENIVPLRPMTHDLFKSFVSQFEAEVKEIIIHELRNNTFYAKIVCKLDNGINIKIDSRPSDAIAIALRFRIKIYTTSEVMNEAGVEISDEKESSPSEKTFRSKQKKYIEAEELHSKSIDELNQMITEAVKEENYEQAAKIRDEINKR